MRLTKATFLPKGPLFVVSRHDQHGEQEQKTIPRSFGLGTVSAIWNVDDETPARYPFASESPYPDRYWNMELHLADELFCYSGEIVGPTNLACTACDTDLVRGDDEHPVLGGWLTEIAIACPSCKRAVVPAEHECDLNLDAVPSPTKTHRLTGGGLFRCGFFIDCHKSIPTMPAQLHPELRAILHETFGPSIEFPDIH